MRRIQKLDTLGEQYIDDIVGEGDDSDIGKLQEALAALVAKRAKIISGEVAASDIERAELYRQITQAENAIELARLTQSHTKEAASITKRNSTASFRQAVDDARAAHKELLAKADVMLSNPSAYNNKDRRELRLQLGRLEIAASEAGVQL
jgi:hypothetical protein